MEQESYKPEVQEHIVFGRRIDLVMLAKENSVIVHSFEGGYDDYDGAMAWVKLPSPLHPNRKLTRFCASPGRWLSGVRI